MGLHPGFFASVNFAASTLTQPSDEYDVSGLTYAVVLHDEQLEWPNRWSTWTLDADALLLYQPRDENSQMLVGNAGHIYILDDSIHTDDSVAIPISIRTVAIPQVDDEVKASSFKRFQHVWWELETAPPSTGYEITVRLTDANDPSNYTQRTVLQYTTRMHITMPLRCRQAYLSLTATVGKDFNPTNMGYSFQQGHVRQTTKLT